MGAFIDDELKDSAEGSSKRAAEQLTAKKNYFDTLIIFKKPISLTVNSL